MRYVLATHNAGKIAEMQQYFQGAPYTLISQSQSPADAPEETGTTFVENALLKARHTATYSGCASIADDSGLVVPSLLGAPGLYSARFAGPSASDAENVALLLARMTGVVQRQAFFYCIIVLVRYPTDPMPIICEGQWAGEITLAPQGTHGFGYDPIFWIPSKGCTSASLTANEKNLYSHRGQALKKLRTALDLEHRCLPNV